jgi:hypothetical protein
LPSKLDIILRPKAAGMDFSPFFAAPPPAYHYMGGAMPLSPTYADDIKSGPNSGGASGVSCWTSLPKPIHFLQHDANDIK